MVCTSFRWGRVGLVAIALGWGGCSDDGVAQKDGASGGGTGDVATSDDGSPATSLTATATNPTTAGGADAGEGTTDEPGADTAGVSDSGDTTGSVDTGPAGDETTDGGSDGDTGMQVPPECMVDADCMVVEDCCECGALPNGEVPPACAPVCEQSVCLDVGITMPQAQCTFGHCELVPVDCNPAFVTCKMPPPPCPPGLLPSVDNGCWSGFCVPADDCDVVPDCTWCEGDETCVSTTTQVGVFTSCVPTDDACGGTADCTCMGEVCEAPFMCGPGTGDAPLECFCPVC